MNRISSLLWSSIIAFLSLTYPGQDCARSLRANATEGLSPEIALVDHRLRDFYANKQYFDLRDALREDRRENSGELLFYRGAVHNKFNRPWLSNRYLNSYLNLLKAGENSQFVIECYEMQADNYRKTFQYRKAAKAYNVLLTRFGSNINKVKEQSYENEYKLWRALESVPSQTATFKGDSLIKKDREGHVPFKIDGRELALTFDTGANLSVIRDSLARKFGLKVIEASIDVGAVSGLKVKAKLAVARKIELGNASIRNAIFLVFADKYLYISEANFQLDGVIGFPVIAALREVTFRRDGRLFVPVKPGKGGEQNMCLDGFSPLIAGSFKGQRLTFAFDTGANASTLYLPFFRKFKTEIEGKYDPDKEKVRGVGGYREIKGYLAKNLTLTFSGQQAHYDQIPILTEQTTENSQHFYGNLGTDLVGQFESMTLNFESMSIVFE